MNGTINIGGEDYKVTTHSSGLGWFVQAGMCQVMVHSMSVAIPTLQAVAQYGCDIMASAALED